MHNEQNFKKYLHFVIMFVIVKLENINFIPIICLTHFHIYEKLQQITKVIVKTAL